MSEQTSMHLEFWVPRGRTSGSWMRSDALPLGHDSSLYARTWRRVCPGHKHADKLAHSISRIKGPSACDRILRCQNYCLWAKAKGLTSVTTYRGDVTSNSAASLTHLASREVDVAEFIGPAPSPEVCRDED